MCEFVQNGDPIAICNGAECPPASDQLPQKSYRDTLDEATMKHTLWPEIDKVRRCKIK